MYLRRYRQYISTYVRICMYVCTYVYVTHAHASGAEMGGHSHTRTRALYGDDVMTRQVEIGRASNSQKEIQYLDRLLVYVGQSGS